MIIDVHTHIFQDPGTPHTPENLVASMKEAGIDYSMVIADGFMPGGVSTEETIAVCEKFPELKAIGNVHFAQLDEKQIETLINYLKEGKIHAVKIYPGYENFYPTDERLFPLFEECEKLGKTIIFHTGILMAGLPGLLKQVHPLNIDEVANKFPRQKIVMAHFGNPWIADAAVVALRHKNVYVDLSGYFKEFFPLSVEETDSFIKDLTYFKNFTGSFEKCIFGTDWPLYSQKEYLEVVERLPMTKEERELVLWKNAAEVYGIHI